MVNNTQILDQITNEQEKIVFKGMRADMESGKALLNPEQLGTFLREAKLNNTILADSTFDYMKSFKKQLAHTSINGRVLQNGYKANGETNNELNKADVKFGYNELDAKKLKALCEISDDEKEDNLEQNSFEQTLLSMMGERVGEDLEFWALFGDTESDNELLATNDGWLKKAESENQLDSTNDFNLAEGTVEDMFDKMITNMPPRIRQNRTKLKFYVPFEVEDAYRNLLKSRGTPLGDTNQTGFNNLTYKGIPIVHCHTFDAEDAREEDGTAKSILTNPKNMHWGIWKNLTIEPKRIVEDEITQYYYRLRGDVDYEFRNGIMVASMTEEEAEAIAAESKF